MVLEQTGRLLLMKMIDAAGTFNHYDFRGWKTTNVQTWTLFDLNGLFASRKHNACVLEQKTFKLQCLKYLHSTKSKIIPS